MSIDFNKLNREIAEKKRAEAAKTNIIKRKDKAPIGIYCLPIIETEDIIIRCIFCGHPTLETRNRVLYISAYPSSPVERAVYDVIACKRCGQRYTKLL